MYTISSFCFRVMGGFICLWYLHVFSMHWYFLISSYYLTVSNGVCFWYLHVCSIHCFEWCLPLVSTCLLYSLVFPYIFLLFDCFEWVLIDCIEKHRVHSALWQFQMGVHQPLVSTCFLYALVFPYIFLLFDCFEWVLIDHIEKHSVHSVLWQF